VRYVSFHCFNNEPSSQSTAPNSSDRPCTTSPPFHRHAAAVLKVRFCVWCINCFPTIPSLVFCLFSCKGMRGFFSAPTPHGFPAGIFSPHPRDGELYSSGVNGYDQKTVSVYSPLARYLPEFSFFSFGVLCPHASMPSFCSGSRCPFAPGLDRPLRRGEDPVFLNAPVFGCLAAAPPSVFLSSTFFPVLIAFHILFFEKAFKMYPWWLTRKRLNLLFFDPSFSSPTRFPQVTWPSFFGFSARDIFSQAPRSLKSSLSHVPSLSLWIDSPFWKMQIRSGSGSFSFIKSSSDN